jgi:putative protease
LEEAGARVEILGLYSMISLPDINQVYLVFRAKLLHLDFAPGEESLEAACSAKRTFPGTLWPSAPSIAPCKQFYVVSNIFPHNAKLKTYLADMAPVVALQPDALIMADPGLIDMIRNTWPEMPVHLSVQANTVNYAAVKFWQKLGISRVILSRELSLDQVAEIRQECPDMELEVFVHGALCIAYSGRCLLSGYFNHRDPNQGTCTNSCRWEFNTKPGTVGPDGDVFLLEEPEKRAGSHMPIEEDEHGTYILNSKDLRAIEHVQRLTEIGVDSLKIEGRTKSPYYVARTAQAYRQAIDDAVAGRPLNPSLLRELDGLANRGYTGGFFERHPDREYQNYLRGHSESDRSLYVGDVLAYDNEGMAEIEVKNKFSVGDRIELIHPQGNLELEIAAMRGKNDSTVSVAPGNGHRVRIPLPAGYEGAFVARFVDAAEIQSSARNSR